MFAKREPPSISQADGTGHQIITADCLDVLRALPSRSIHVVVTSPPYNLGKVYDVYRDNMTEEAYLEWTSGWLREIARVLKPDGSLFMNIGGSPRKPLMPHKMALLASEHFVLQNQIIWVKSLSVPDSPDTLYQPGDGLPTGHFMPINSERFLNSNWEFVFHFTIDGRRPLDRLSIGVPYVDPANTRRWKDQATRRCAGNVWLIPYETRTEKAVHPAAFPVALAERCIKLCGLGPGAVVLDTFAGTGTTAVAAQRLGVSSISIELSDRYCGIAYDRLRDAAVQGHVDKEQSCPVSIQIHSGEAGHGDKLSMKVTDTPAEETGLDETEVHSMETVNGPKTQSIEDHIARLRQDPVGVLEQDIDDLGFSVQHDAFVMAVLSEVSAAAQHPLSVLLVGNPASGKSTVAGTTAQLVGTDFVVSASGMNQMTAAAASRMAERLTHHCLVCDERAGNSQFDALWRQALSGRPASRIITVQNQPVELTVMPPISSVEAVLSDKEMTPQDRSRYLRIRLREDGEALNAIRRLTRQSATVDGRRRQQLLEHRARAYQVFLASLRRDLFIEVPFAEQINVGEENGFAVRIEKHVLRAIQAVAWWRQGSRPVEYEADIGHYIQATPEDYAVIYDILLRSAEDGSTDLSDNALLVFRRWKDWAAERGNTALGRKELNEFMTGRLSIWQTYRALRELRDLDLADGPTGHGIRGAWRLTDLGLATERPNAFLSLPNPDQLQDTGAKLQMPVIT